VSAARSLRAYVIAAAAVVLVVVAACGGSATTMPSTGAAASSAPTPAPTAAPASSAAAGGSAAGSPVASEVPSSLPSFTRVADLEAMLPAKVGDVKLEPRSLTGTDVLATGDPTSIKALQAMLDATGATAADYQFAYSPFKTAAGTDAAIGVFRVKGSDPEKLRDILIEQGRTNNQGVGPAKDATVGGKQVVTLEVQDGQGTTWTWYYWPKGDVLFYLQTVDPSVAAELIAAL
jgi:hypothetical protein